MHSSGLSLSSEQIPLSEKPTARRYFLWQHGEQKLANSTAWDRYQSYLSQTSIFFPMPKSLYGNLPPWVKRRLLLDFEVFRFDETSDGAKALQEDS